MPMAAAASSATTGASRSTASTACSRPSRRSARRSTTCGRPTKSSAMREELAEQMRALEDLAAMAQALRLRHHAAGGERAGSRAVDLFRLSRRDQGGERRGDVDRPHLDLPRHLYRARPEGRHARRSRRAGAVGPARAEAAHRALPAHAGLRRAVQRRSLLGDRMRRRHGSERPAAGDQEQLPHAAHADQSRAGAGAEHHGAVVEAPAGRPSSAIASRSARRRRRCSTRTTT